MHIERAEGGQQVFSTAAIIHNKVDLKSEVLITCGLMHRNLDHDAAVPIYIDRLLTVEYLHTLVSIQQWPQESTRGFPLHGVPFVAMSRVNVNATILGLRFFNPMR